MVNYIHHVESVMDSFKDDNRITPWHISLYFSLFHIWNNVRFKDEINIRRDELMTLSKIGSANTYTRCLKELHEWKYIKYTPSKSKFISSKVHMYRFDTTPNTSSDNTTDTSCDTTSDNTSVHHLRPFINNNKPIENNNKHKSSRDVSHTSKPREDVSHTPTTTRKGELHSPHTPIPPIPQGKTQKRFTPPSQEEIKIFFSENNSNNQESQKYYNHFQSNGWLVGGKTPMKDWKAAARNWILRAQGYAEKANPTLQRLNVNQNNNYDEPL